MYVSPLAYSQRAKQFHLSEVAKKYKRSEVVGIDISDIQPSVVPQNVEFILDDFNLEKYEEKSAQYDLIHGRDLYGSVLNWPGLIGKCFK